MVMCEGFVERTIIKGMGEETRFSGVNEESVPDGENEDVDVDLSLLRAVVDSESVLGAHNLLGFGLGAWSAQMEGQMEVLRI